MLVYVRHSEDDSEDATYEHDPKLTKEGKKLAYKKGTLLLQKYGVPDVIYCSPFRRTRQTLDYMLRNLSERMRKQVQVIYDPNCSRYFSNTEREDPDVAFSTMKGNIPIYENRQDFRLRAKNLSTKLSKFIRAGKLVWCITHTTMYKRLAKIYEITLPEFIPYADHYVVRKRIKPLESLEESFCKSCNAGL